uniref:Uncharacterized protein n=1 Tax=Anguilla anguilla TaxID=7936 RepID=A0A0E9TNZ3_ANGAN
MLWKPSIFHDIVCLQSLSKSAM